AVTEDLVAADNLIADDARLQLGATTNISHDRDAIIDGLSRLADRYSVEDNRITMLDGYSASRDGAVVHLACWTEATGYGFYTPSQWVLRVERQNDGTWKVARITCISINAEPPPPLP
ncbi:MAG: hypothetical protein SYC29_02450, partial [Planctomycetota bacterium]|nr:hypothetical protein [Planctomycetota bacterium]